MLQWLSVQYNFPIKSDSTRADHNASVMQATAYHNDSRTAVFPKLLSLRNS